MAELTLCARHAQTKRDYVARMLDDKIACMKEARKFEYQYWDGDRRFGYGGYEYRPGWWEPTARGLVERYDLKAGDAIFDLGCGKGFLLYELQKLIPGLELVGMDRSEWALANRHPDLKATLMYGKAQFELGRFADAGFELVISLGMFHNLRLFELATALPEFERIGKQRYLMVESFRDEAEWFNLVCWCLTAESLLRPEDWKHLFKLHGYSGDFEFIYFT